MSEKAERRWTIYVCPNCGKRKAGAYFCRCVIPSDRCQKVEVVPASDLQATQEAAEGLVESIEEMQDRMAVEAQALGDEACMALNIWASRFHKLAFNFKAQQEGSSDGD